MASVEHPDQLWCRFMQSEEAAEGYVDGVLTGDGFPVTLDRYGSVSGLIRFDSGLIRPPTSTFTLPKEGPHGW